MPIRVTCTNCGTSGAAPDNAKGATVRCKSCQQVITVPLDSAPDPDDLSHPDNWRRAMESAPPQVPVTGPDMSGVIDELQSINAKLKGIWIMIVLLPVLYIILAPVITLLSALLAR